VKLKLCKDVRDVLNYYADVIALTNIEIFMKNYKKNIDHLKRC